MALPEELQEKIIDAICAEIPEILGIYVYGSAAANALREESDIDLAVLAAAPVPDASIWELSEKLAVLIRRDVDLVDLRKAPTVLRFQIIHKGFPIFRRDSHECEIFEDYVWSDYIRLNEERAGILSDIRRRGNVYG